MPTVYNAMQLKSGAKSDYHRMGTFTQPVQFLLESQKDEEWGAWNLDWLEMQGLKQIRRNARRLLKNYKLANGVIDKSDYISEEDNEQAELIDYLTKEDESTYDLKFFPIIPNVIDLLVGEFAKRNDKIIYKATDDRSYNEMLDEKQNMIEQIILQNAEQRMLQKAQQMGLEIDNPEHAEQMEELMSIDSLKTLPGVEEFFKKTYRSSCEQWATHQHNADEERFSLKELEIIGFKDSLIADREFWHFELREDDYDIELWNPILTFYHKSPQAKYISQGNYVGNMDMMTIADVIDKYGYLMTKDQLDSLESIYPIKSAGYILPGVQNDGSYYDATKSHKWNVEGPSLGMRQFMSYKDVTEGYGDDIVARILDNSEDLQDFDNTGLLRVTKCYWKSQRMIGHLTRINEIGMLTELIVDENYKCVDKPVYDTSIIKGKKRENLIFGEHVEWIWINHVWGGIKIGPNRPTFYGNSDNATGFNPIYLNVKPLKFQFKGDFSIYGSKLPVEGCVFSDRNTKSRSAVDKMKPFQIGYNLVNNQVSDILIDELGTVLLLDHNTLPQHSMGEDWGKNNLSKAYVAMKDFQILPLDTSITNTENALNFQNFQVLDLSQTQRLLTRVQLSNHFKAQCFETMGITPQRMGNITSQETATGVEQAINMSYAQTEMYFVQHSELLMPRVHQMRTDLAQYYHSTNPSVRLQYITSLDEKINFEINGTELLSREINVFVSSKVNHKYILEQMKSLAMQNNTAGASIFDLGNIIKSDSLSEVNHVLLSIEEKNQKALQEQQQAEQQAIEMEQQYENQRLEAELKFKAEQAALDREKDIKVAEIRAAGYTAMNDRDENSRNDYIDTLEYLDKRQAKEQEISLAREKEINRQAESQTEAQLKREEIQAKKEVASKQLEIAKTNKNKYDAPSKNKKK